MKGEQHRDAPCAESYALEKILKEVSDIVSLLEDAQKVMNELVRLTTRLLKVGNCSLVLIEPGTDVLRIHASYGLNPEIVRTWRARIGEGITGWVAQTGKPLLIENVETHPLFQRKSLRRYSTKSLLSVPLIYQKRVLGVLNVNNRNDARRLHGIGRTAPLDAGELHRDRDREVLDAREDHRGGAARGGPARGARDPGAGPAGGAAEPGTVGIRRAESPRAVDRRRLLRRDPAWRTTGPAW